MKKMFSLLFVIMLATVVNAQQDSLQPPYKRFPTVPPFQLQLADSITMFTKEKLQKKMPVMIMLFNPQCEHCEHEIDEIIKNIKEFKKIQIVL
ncbi:MAG TPA: hypothetical protein VLJ68_04165, partial [Chitinophagaceae bacterium]|nr:hypothetical protein [Chitinophagaceae bacterium]